MNRRVQFLRAPLIDDGHGERLGAYVPHGRRIWASRDPVSDGEKFRADSTARDMTDRYRVHYSRLAASITLADRLVCEGRTYGIAGIKEIGFREGFEITARALPDRV